MHLKSLTIKGFKSFAQPTTFRFETGVTCIVGPNGSGKSNVVDALAWVMGEQGAKTLRGGTMSDVIFAGTTTRGPLGRAEVQLTIDNADGALPIEYSEVTISRTLFRNGGSEYAINGTACRLLDVQELLSDSGLGREMHVIVGQGQLDAVLHASPDERRGFIEEAAGILKHRRRKEKTVRKLEAMQANLTRLSDLAGEFRRQLTPLGRQAEIAREAQTIAAIVRDARARLLADEVVALRTALVDYARSESERTSERIVVQSQLDQTRLRVQRIEARQGVGDAVDEARRLAFELEQVQERVRSLASLTQQRLTLLSQQGDVPGLSNTISQVQVDEARAEALLLRVSVAAAEGLVGDVAARTATARATLDALDDEIVAQSALVSQHDLQLAALASRVDVARSTLDAARGELLRQQTALAAAETRQESTRTELAALPALDDGVDTEESRKRDAVLTDADARVGELSGRIDVARDALHARERERDALAARVSALSQAVDSGDGATGLIGSAGIRGLVSDHLRVRAGFEAAIAAALGTLAEAALADDLDVGLRALERAHAAEAGRVNVVLAEIGGRASTILPSVAGLTAATDVVTAPPGVMALLARTLIADDLAAARAAWPAVMGFDGAETVSIVTRQGDVLTRSVLRGGSGAGRSRLELTAERDAASAALTEVATGIERARGALDDTRAALAVAKQLAIEALAAVRDQDAQRAARSEQASRVRAQTEAAEAEAARLATGVDSAQGSTRDAELAVERAKAELEEFAARPRPLLDASAREGLLADGEAARAVELERRIELETARERMRAALDGAEHLDRRRIAEKTAADEAARRAVLRLRQVRQATAVAAALPAVQWAIDRSVAEARVALAQRESERAAQNEESLELRRSESSLRERLAAITEGVHGLELQIYEKKLHLAQLLERAGAELGLVEDVLVDEYGPEVLVPDDGALTVAARAVADAIAAEAAARVDPDPDAPAFDPTNDEESARVAAIMAEAAAHPFATQAQRLHATGDSAHAGVQPEARTPPTGRSFDRAEQQARLARGERKLSQLGRINPLALEEFAALEQRHKFLTGQLADLANTRRDLLTIIDEVDATMQTIFAAAFADTQAAFDVVFPILFPGGTGSLTLTEPDNLLTSGIEVTVKPAGKKIERLSLLSGGERSLAAVALLIAIFKARPSPFYIMDEVEAALDDANLGRLLSIFRDLRHSSQLIIVTHQKRTMEIADALYGVSMRQDGVSAVVGQRVQSPDERAS